MRNCYASRLSLAVGIAGAMTTVAAAQTNDDGFEAMAKGENGYTTSAIHTVGQTISETSGVLNPSTAGDYTPVGILDGLGAYALDDETIRVFANHELLNFRGNEYEVSDGEGGTFSLKGARVSYFDIDKADKTIVDSGIAYNQIYDANGDIATDASIFSNEFEGFSRFCSANLIEAERFGDGRGLASTVFFTGEEDGGGFNRVGGAEWALDPETGSIWQLPALGRGAWENVTEIDTGTTDHIAMILSDDTSPFDFDGDEEDEAVPLYLYVGEKQPDATLENGEPDFPAINGLRDGKLYVWVAEDSSINSPVEFNGSGSLAGGFVEIDNAPVEDESLFSDDGTTGYDEYGYKTQSALVQQAEMLSAFGFSRPEDVAVNPEDGTEFVLASTGVDTFDIDPATGNGVDTFGTIYTMKVDFSDIENPTGDLTILYDGDADPERQLRSPDNLDWADDGSIYVQEDEAEETTASEDEVLFGEDAANPNEAGIIKITRGEDGSASLQRVVTIDRSVVLDPSIDDPTAAVDVDAGDAGEWESSGIVDVSSLFDRRPGTLFLFTVQAHGIEDQTETNEDSRINDDDLVEGGQLLFLSRGDLN